MKNIIKPLLFALIAFVLVSCQSEEKLEPKFTYDGPVPAIVQGTTNAEKLCYALYTTYDLHVYCTLSGDDALKTGVGSMQTNGLLQTALPLSAADPVEAEKFLKLLTKFYESLPKKLVTNTVQKRIVLVAQNCASNNYSKYVYYQNAASEDPQGIVIFGDLRQDPALNVTQAEFKMEIARSFFTSIVARADIPAEFGLVSKGLYASENPNHYDLYEDGEEDEDYNPDWSLKLLPGANEIIKPWGFVHLTSYLRASEDYSLMDIGAFAAWITNTPKATRDVDIAKYEKINTKYEMTLKYFKDNFNTDLEAVSVAWCNYTI